MNQPSSVQSHSLLRSLGFKETAALVVGTVIGTGVFLKAAGMSQIGGSAGWVLIAWAVAGALSFAGALCYAELGSRFPSAGGEYVFLREGYGEAVAFSYGWTRFWVGSPATIAAYAVGAATFLAEPLGLAGSWQRAMVAAFIVAALSLLNSISVAFGGRVQVALTWLKMALIIGLSSAIFVLARDGAWAHLAWTPAVGSLTAVGIATRAAAGSSTWLGPFPGWSAFGVIMIAALWAYDGWNNMPMAAGEVKNPTRNIPLALGAGMATVVAIYAFANLSYFYALPFGEVVASNSEMHPDALPVATRAAQSVFGSAAALIFSIAFSISAIGALNGSILTCARIPYAMAQDGLFFRILGTVSAVRRVPVAALAVQSVVSIALALSGSFDTLTDCVIVSAWIFYGLAAGALFKLRKKPLANHQDNLYRAPFFPWLPVVFILCAIGLVGNALFTLPFASAVGIAISLSGFPAYALFKRAGRKKTITP